MAGWRFLRMSRLRLLELYYWLILRVINVLVFKSFSVRSSVLYCCSIGDRKGIQPVKNECASVVIWLVQTCTWPSWCHCHSLSLTWVKARLVSSFWYWLTWVVTSPGQRVVKWVCVCVFTIALLNFILCDTMHITNFIIIITSTTTHLNSKQQHKILPNSNT